MKFLDYLRESLTPSIDDNDVLNRLDALGIYYDRIKSDNGKLLYTFDNRYSLEYDGSMFILYRHQNIIHRSNARNKKEVDDSLNNWNKSYQMNNTELTDDDIDDLIDKIKRDSGDAEASDDADIDKKEEETK